MKLSGFAMHAAIGEQAPVGVVRYSPEQQQQLAVLFGDTGWVASLDAEDPANSSRAKLATDGGDAVPTTANVLMRGIGYAVHSFAGVTMGQGRNRPVATRANTFVQAAQAVDLLEAS